MSGSPCPKCGQQVMSFREFFLHAEPHKTYRCAGCCAELSRSAGVWVTVILLGIAAGIVAVVAASQDLQPWTILALGALAIIGGTFVVKLVNYKLPLWRVKGQRP